MEDCISLIGILGAVIGFTASEAAQYLREWFTSHRRRKLARAQARHELRFQRENAEILLAQYTAARRALGGNEEFSRAFPRIVMTCDGLEAAKNQLIETGAEEHLISALHRAIRELTIVESVRPGAMAKLEELLGQYSKQHREYVGYLPWIKYLSSLDSALLAAVGILVDAEKPFQERC